MECEGAFHLHGWTNLTNFLKEKKTVKSRETIQKVPGSALKKIILT
jgi:hypothetical protein